MNHNEVVAAVVNLTDIQRIKLGVLLCGPAESSGFMPTESAAALGVARRYIEGSASETEFADAVEAVHQACSRRLEKVRGYDAGQHAASAVKYALRGDVVLVHHHGLRVYTTFMASWETQEALDGILQSFLKVM